MPLRDIETIVIVLMENRSFDHALGYLGLSSSPFQKQVEGLSSDPTWLDQYANEHAGLTVRSFRLDPTIQAIDDPKHDHASVAVQIGTPPRDPNLNGMGGFVQSYATRSDTIPADPSLVMGYYDREAVPVFDFFARNFMVCDHWFAALPTGTQANRLMAMGGTSCLLDNGHPLIPDQPLVYDWLDRHRIDWRVYKWGSFFPFFSLMPKMWPEIVESLALSSGRFRRFDGLARDWASADERRGSSSSSPSTPTAPMRILVTITVRPG